MKNPEIATYAFFVGMLVAPLAAWKGRHPIWSAVACGVGLAVLVVLSSAGSSELFSLTPLVYLALQIVELSIGGAIGAALGAGLGGFIIMKLLGPAKKLFGKRSQS
ncbi:MAG: hypothetical protein WKF37_07665 [Bryobacteraceae bacterium]